ncbi:hypothetical protein PG993_000895 [Apiospora rasikravindrae]|uniref:Uncharacterized protein n=1 Tax=Apiospora rasikravindrae TaxID=990691 RepID=A0ABR1UCI3_9PEZI
MAPRRTVRAGFSTVKGPDRDTWTVGDGVAGADGELRLGLARGRPAARIEDRRVVALDSRAVDRHQVDGGLLPVQRDSRGGTGRNDCLAQKNVQVRQVLINDCRARVGSWVAASWTSARAACSAVLGTSLLGCECSATPRPRRSRVPHLGMWEAIVYSADWQGVHGFGCRCDAVCASETPMVCDLIARDVRDWANRHGFLDEKREGVAWVARALEGLHERREVLGQCQ